MGGGGRRGTRALVAGAITLAWLGAVPSVATGEGTVAFVLRDQRIVESSGLTRDTAADLYWTINDSGDVGVAYAVTATGAMEGTLRYLAKPVDVEAIAMLKNRLYIADIGDNRRSREFVTVFAFDNPQPRDQVSEYQAYDFSYPDGPHDAETLLVDRAGRLSIVTKDAKGGVYQAPRQPSRRGVNTLKRVADAPAFVTDGVILPGGTQIALRTYVSVIVVSAKDYSLVAQAPTPVQPQGESLAVSLDGDSLLVGSEGKRSKVFTMDIPARVEDVPSGSASPPRKKKPSPSPSSSASKSDPAEPSAGPTSNPNGERSGTWWVLGLAGVVALLAGGYTGFSKKR